jgi:Protein of unknown function (DUF1616)
MPKGRSRLAGRGDIAIAAALGGTAPLLLPGLPPGSALRIILASITVLLVPGYLLLRAVEPRMPKAALEHIAMAFGVAPALVGLAALSTALLPNGFTAANIALSQAGLMLTLGVVAFMRCRLSLPFQAPALTASLQDPAPKTTLSGQVQAEPLAAAVPPVESLLLPVHAPLAEPVMFRLNGQAPGTSDTLDLPSMAARTGAGHDEAILPGPGEPLGHGLPPSPKGSSPDVPKAGDT